MITFFDPPLNSETPVGIEICLNNEGGKHELLLHTSGDRRVCLVEADTREEIAGAAAAIAERTETKFTSPTLEQEIGFIRRLQKAGIKLKHPRSKPKGFG
ncbi:MAG: hypothetical protein AAGA75_26280 [Cyanobacteria bacterium P01_E01_bin.6]